MSSAMIFLRRTSRLHSIRAFSQSCDRRKSQHIQTNLASAGVTRSPLSSSTKLFYVLSLGAAALIGYWTSQTQTNRLQKNHAILDKKQLQKIDYASFADLEKAIAEMRTALPGTEDIISTDDDDLHAHGYSEWSSTNIETLPVAVAYPRSTEDVCTIAKICFKYKIPMIPYSGGSSVEGHITAPFGGVSMDFSFMDKIVQFNSDDMDVVVQPGLCWTDLNTQLASLGSGLFFPIDPAPAAKIGGMVATNCSGTNAVRYGTMRDWVVNLTVVLADGSVVKTRRRPRKCSAGYNLNGILVGSEGTLGFVTEATLKLAAIPEQYSVAVVPFEDVKTAVSAATSIIRRGIPVAALELMDEKQMNVVNEGGATRPRVWREEPTLFIKFSGTKVSIADNIESVKKAVAPFRPRDFEFAKDSKEQELLWSARKESLYSLLALRKEGETMWNTDVAVPLGRLAEIVDISKSEAEALGLKACVKGHVGDSNFHENITYTKDDPVQAANAEKAVKNMVRRALEMQGTCTGEHGIGLGKKAALISEVGEDTLMIMKLIKNTLDPLWLMNPGKVFDIDVEKQVSQT